MKILRGKASLLILLLLGFYAMSGVLSPVAAQEEGRQGLFGSVADVLVSTTGLTVIILDTKQGEVELLASPETAVSIPGRETASLSDISVGDFLAVLAKKVEENLEAEKVLVKPSNPVATAHTTGVVVESATNRLVIVDRDGNRITIELGPGIADAPPGQVVTAVVRQDLASGSLSAQGIETADKNIERLQVALERAQSQGVTRNLENLKVRLKENTTGNLTVLQNVLQRVPEPARPAIERNLEAFKETSRRALATFDLGPALVRLVGVVELVDALQRIALVTPEDGEQVEILITDDTRILLGGSQVGLERLLLGHRVKATYDPDTGEGHFIEIFIGVKLQPKQEQQLLALAKEGEAEGAATAIFPTTTPPRLTLLTSTGDTLTLTVGPTTQIEVRGIEASLQDIVLNARLKARYNPSTLQAILIETFDIVSGESFSQGVMQSFNRKTGDVQVIQPDGATLLLKLTPNTIIEKDGLKVTISEVKLGDLVRPTTRYVTSTKELKRLGLKSPPALPLLGIIRGKVTQKGVDSLTISTDDLKLVTVTVTGATRIERQGGVIGFAALEIGERVVTGLYNLVTLEATQLVVQPARTLQIRGTISALNPDVMTVTITPEVGDLVTLIVSKRSVITKQEKTEANFNDLAVGDEVRLAFYRAGTKELVRIVVI